jgi:hypothetical protein
MKSLLRLSLFVVAASLGGCAPKGPADAEFFGDYENGSLRYYANAQAAAGARNDAMLDAAHFDGAYLNSLGCDKLDLMVSAAERRLPVVVFVDLPGESKEQRQAVETYLKDTGLKAGQYRVEAGTNPAPGAPAARPLADLPRTDSASESGQNRLTMTPSGGGTRK